MRVLLALFAAWLWLDLLDDATREERAFFDARGARDAGGADGA